MREIVLCDITLFRNHSKEDVAYIKKKIKSVISKTLGLPKGDILFKLVEGIDAT